MENNIKRMQEIQESLTKHINKELKDDEDLLYMATMLLKHAMILYKEMLSDEEIKNMLGHVIDTIGQDFPTYEYIKSSKKTIH